MRGTTHDDNGPYRERAHETWSRRDGQTGGSSSHSRSFKDGRDDRGSRSSRSHYSVDPYRSSREQSGGRDERDHRRRSQSPSRPDFSLERARERDAYDRRHGTGAEPAAHSEEGLEDKAPSMEPDFGASGLLAQESNSKNGVTLKYFEPPEARKPKRKWRLYVFKDGKEVDLLHISRQSCYLIGRDHAVVDIPVDHPSISKQHAVIQFRSMTERDEYGDEKRATKPFLIDLESANGCTVNMRDVPASRYYELRKGDTVRLGGSGREYVLLPEE